MASRRRHPSTKHRSAKNNVATRDLPVRWRRLGLERLERRDLLSSVSLGASFGGMNENYASWYPLQITAAEGPHYVVDVAGGQMAIFSTSGQFIENISMTANWTSNGYSGSGANGDNPTVVYDPTVAGGGRYIICDGVTTVYFGISKTSDPTQGWYWYTIYFPTTDDGGRFGFNNSAYFVWYSAGGSNPNTTVIQKSSILSGGTMVDYTQNAVGHPTLQVDDTLSYGTGAGDPAWFYSTTQLIEETNYLSSSPTFTTYNISGGTFSSSKYAEIRTINGVETMAGINDDASLSWSTNGVTSLYWSEVNIATATVIQSGTIYTPSGWTDMGYAYSSLAPNGDLGFTFLDVTANQTEMGMFITGRGVGDAAGTTDTPIAAFVGTYDGTRVGDYGSVNADINNDTFWATEYSDSHPGYTSIVNFGLTNTAPAVMQPVMGFGATPSNGTNVNLQWNAVPGATSYEIIRSTDDVTFTPVATGLTSTSYTDTPGGTVSGLYYDVLAFNASTDSAAPTAIQVTLAPTPPTYDSLTAPTGLAAVLAATGTGISLSWNSVASGSGYFLWRSTTGSTWTQIAAITSNSTVTDADSGLTGGQLYYYRVATRDSSGGQSSPSAAVTIVNRPSAPTVTVDTGWSNQLQVDWNLIPSATSYTVLRSADGVNYTTLGTSAANNTTYTDFTVLPNTEYWYEVVANGTVGSSTPTAATGVTSLTTVTGLTITQGAAQLALQWTAVANATSYQVQRSTDDSTFSIIAITSSNSFTDTGATPLTTYYYRITAVDAQTGVSSASPSAVVYSTATPTTSLPYQWQSQDVGISNIGAAGFSAGAYTLVGEGSDIWGTSDQFHYAYLPMTGNVTIVAKVNSIVNTGAWVKAGVMIRNSLSASDQYALECITPSEGSAFQYRTTSGGSANGTSGDTGPAAPYWVKLVRSGTTITGYRSSNGTTWTQDSSTNITFTNSTVYVGLELDTDSTSAVTSTAVFSNVSVTNSAFASPTVATAASASPGTVTGTTTNLSVLGADATGASNLYYTWSATSLPSGAAQPTFSPNSTNAAKNATATFSQAGAYTLTATITNGYGLTVTSSVNVTVNQTATSITISPSSAIVNFAGTQQFTAYNADQFGQPIAGAISPTWTISPTTGAGTLSSSGLYTAPSTQTTATITATSGSLTATAGVQVFNRDTFTNTAGGSWATTTNWQGGTVASGAGVASDFSTLALTAAPTVTLDGAETVGDLLFGDTNNSYGWTLNTGTGGPLTLSTTSGTPTIYVANQTSTIGAVLAGTAGLTKTGSGALTISGTGTWTGTTTVAAGTLQVNAKSGDVPYVVDAGATLKIGYTTGGSYATTAMSLYGSGTSSTAGLYLNGGTLYNVSGGVVLYTAPTVIHQYGTGLAKIGIFDIHSTPGLSVTAAASGSSLDPNIELVNEGYGMVITTAPGAYTSTGDLTVNGPIAVGSDGLYKEGTGSLLLNGYAASTNTAVNIEAGSVITGVNDSLGVNSNIVLYTGTTLVLDGTSQAVANLSSYSTGAGTIVGSSATTSSLNVTQSTANTYSGILGGTGTNQNNLSFTKSGLAALNLSGSNTYSGGTTIVAGTLLATNTGGSATGSGAVTVDSGAILGGTGTINSPVTVASGGVIMPGSSGTGTLTVSNTLSLSGNADFDINASTGTTGLIKGITTLTYGGTLNVTNLAGTLASGQSYKLFAATTYSGSFSTFNLPALGPSLGWNTSTLATTGTISIIVTGTATVVTPASANWTAGSTTVSLSVLGGDAAGQANLTYTWSATGPAAVTYSPNGTNAAQNSVATLTAAGSYTFKATITDVQGASTTSSVTITVGQTVTTIVMTPTSASLSSHATQQFAATAKDQFGTTLTSQPSFTWNVASGGGTIGTGGLYTASYASGSATVTASNGGVTSNSAAITVTDAAPTVATAAAASPTTVTGTTTALTVLGADSDGGGESNLIYTWAAVGPAAVAFSSNGTNASKSSTATFYKAGSYTFTATITDNGGLTTSSSVSVTVNQTATSINLSPTTASVMGGASQQFTATAFDQFGQAMSSQPTVTWSVVGLGAINVGGIYTPPYASGSATVKASTGALGGSASVTFATAAQWNASTSAAWTGSGSWVDASTGNTLAAPGTRGVQGDTVSFVSAAGSVATLNGASPTLAGITFNNASTNYTIAQGSGGSLTLQGSSGASLAVLAGSDAIAAPIDLASSTTVTIAGGSALTLGGAIGGSSLSLSGGGTLTLSGTNSNTGPTTVTGGKLVLNGAGALLAGASLVIGSSNAAGSSFVVPSNNLSIEPAATVANVSTAATSAIAPTPLATRSVSPALTTATASSVVPAVSSSVSPGAPSQPTDAKLQAQAAFFASEANSFAVANLAKPSTTRPVLAKVRAAALKSAMVDQIILNRAILNRAILNRAILNRAILNRAILNRAILNRAMGDVAWLEATTESQQDKNAPARYALSASAVAALLRTGQSSTVGS